MQYMIYLSNNPLCVYPLNVPLLEKLILMGHKFYQILHEIKLH